MNRLFEGFLLVLISVVIEIFFFINGYDEVYWSHPVYFIIVSIMGVFCALYGSFVVGRSLRKQEKHSQRRLSGLSVVTGILFASAGGLLGLIAIGLAIAVSGTGYWGSAPYEYSGDYLIMGWQILALRIAMLIEIVGGFLVGFVLRGKGG
jgi:hypothetical protein